MSNSIDTVKAQHSSADASASQYRLEAQDAGTGHTVATIQTTVAEARMSASQSKVDDVQGQLSPPPTTQVPDGKSSRTVVDEREVARLTRELKSAQSQLGSAQSAKQRGLDDQAATTMLKDIASVNANTSDSQKQDLANRLAALAEVKPEALERKIDAKLENASKTYDKKLDTDEKEIAKSLKNLSAKDLSKMVTGYFNPNNEVTKEQKVLAKVLGFSDDKQGN